MPKKNTDEFESIVVDLLNEDPVKQMEDISCHGSANFLEHSINVAYMSYRICKRFGFDYRAAAKGGMLHDLFLYDWRDGEHNGYHCFNHPHVAYKNAARLCSDADHIDDLTEVEKDIILKHMWPLSPKRPRYRESLVVCLADKMCAMMESLHMHRRMKKRLAHLAA
jgi:uncharacterized protein